jgi:CRP-like cAMP-binding protein
MNEGSRATQQFMDIVNQELPVLMFRKRVLQLRRGDQLTDLMGRPDHLYVIDSAVISLGADLVDGRGAEVALLGVGDLLGLSSVHAWGVMPYRATVQRAGTLWQFNVGGLQNDLLRSVRLSDYIRTVLQRVFVQITQSALCYRHHHIEQQLAKTLLQYQDLTQLEHILLTQQELSELLGVRREGVTQAIGKLQSLGVISSSRGCVHIVSRPQLQRHACECYHHIARTLELPQSLPSGSQPAAVNQRRLSATKTPAVRANTAEITPALISALA